MRMLEDVRARYDRFLQDRRHTGLHVEPEGSAEKQIFDDCSMSFANMDRAGEYPEYDEYVDNQLALDAFKGRRA